MRAVSEPNFHKYVQSSPLLGEGPLVLESHTTAGQLQIVDGQLVQLVSEAGAAEDLLYAVVTTEKTHGGRECPLLLSSHPSLLPSAPSSRSLTGPPAGTLAVSWSTTPNAYGAFAWQGDGLTWSTPEINRPNAMAWYVCEGQRMYVNLGPYLYQTPEGCADQTIHYYNDKTANE